MAGKHAISEAGWYGHARRVPSANSDDRPAGVVVALIVIHNISLPPGRFGGDSVERLFTNRLDPDAQRPIFRELRL